MTMKKKEIGEIYSASALQEEQKVLSSPSTGSDIDVLALSTPLGR
jgi:hypothetical protein